MIQQMAQINMILSNRVRLKPNNDVECVFCESTLAWVEHSTCSVLIYTRHIHTGELPASHWAALARFLFMLRCVFGVHPSSI